MSYPTLLVHLALNASDAGLLQFTADLAQRNRARVIGIAACQPLSMDYGTGYMAAELMEVDRTQANHDLEQAQARFHAALDGKASTAEWRSKITLMSLADYIADEARAADLLVIGGAPKSREPSTRRLTDVSALIIHAGRPIMIVSPDTLRLHGERVIIGWKDTREARRAVADALPFLRQAEQVTVVGIAPAPDLGLMAAHLADVVGWLGRHAITAQADAVDSTGDDPAHLYRMAQDLNAGMLVAGAYGHSRMHEWVLGGVTRELLHNPRHCAFVSH